MHTHAVRMNDPRTSGLGGSDTDINSAIEILVFDAEKADFIALLQGMGLGPGKVYVSKSLISMLIERRPSHQAKGNIACGATDWTCIDDNQGNGYR